jgi:hypothetical protein
VATAATTPVVDPTPVVDEEASCVEAKEDALEGVRAKTSNLVYSARSMVRKVILLTVVTNVLMLQSPVLL